MKIGIDCRLWGVKHAGIGRYTENLVLNLQRVDSKNEYVLFCRKVDFENIPAKKNFKKVTADIPHYSLKEQTSLYRIFNRENLDLLHVPHFNVPLLYRKKFIATIHDVLWHDIKGLRVTTQTPHIYLAKYLAYRAVIRSTVKRAAKIITPSNFVREDLIKRFALQPNKVVVTYEGAPDFRRNAKLQMTNDKLLQKYSIRKPYLLYVGSLYPHKNVEIVVRALKETENLPHLVVICSRSVFWERFREFVKREKAEDFVNLVGYVPDEELVTLYEHSEAFIFPTLSEGFGLPGLEAMAAGCPVVCSDIPVLHEIYGNAALYFDPRSKDDIADKINIILADHKLRSNLVKLGRSQSKKYSWRKMAEKTLVVYNWVCEGGFGIR